MPTEQRITIEDVSEWIAHNLQCAEDQWNNNRNNQCARDVYDRWRICQQYYTTGIYSPTGTPAPTLKAQPDKPTPKRP